MERERVANLSKQTLRTDIAIEALSYLKETRKITDQVIDEFQLGYVPPDIHNDNGDIHEFAGRIVIPVYDQYGFLVALSSRDWRENAYSKFIEMNQERGMLAILISSSGNSKNIFNALSLADLVNGA